MANVDIRLGYKDSAWFTANATLVLKEGQTVHLLQTGTYKIGDGTTQLSVLLFLGSSATSTDLIVATVVNKTGVNLLAANYQAVKISTAQGQRLAVDFAQANNDINSTDTIGLIAQNINVNQEGLINILGQIIEVNTTGSLQSETWADGDVLYLSTTVAGKITNIKPTGLVGHLVVLGYVEYAHAIHGKIYVKITNGFELDELHNVYVNPATLANNDALIYESSSQLWKNKQVITQTVTSGVTDKAPSEDAVFKYVSANEYSSIQCQFSAINLADSTTYFFGQISSAPLTSTNLSRRFRAPFTGKIITVYFIGLSATVTSSQDCSLIIKNVNTNISTTLGNVRFDNVSFYYDFTGLTIAASDGDQLEFQLVTPLLTTNGVGSVCTINVIFKKD
jgi:hypothetical protein